LLYTKSTKLFDKLHLHFFEINPEFLDKYFIKSPEQKIKFIEKAKAFISHINDLEYLNIDNKYLIETYKEAIFEKNTILLYELIYYFIKLTYIKKGKLILDEFFAALNKNERDEFFIKIPGFKNFFLTKLFLVFHSNNFKNKKDEQIPSKFMDITNQLMKQLTAVNSENSCEYEMEKQECVIHILNIINEMIMKPEKSIYKLNLDSETVMKEQYTFTYNACLEIISSRIAFLKLADLFMSDSQIVGSIFRIFRKAIQVLTNENEQLVDINFVACSPQVYSKEFRVSLNLMY
jgi:hypothetical protein